MKLIEVTVIRPHPDERSTTSLQFERSSEHSVITLRDTVTDLELLLDMEDLDFLKAFTDRELDS